MAKYNFSETEHKTANYCATISAERMEELYQKIVQIILIQKKYHDPHYNAQQLARDIDTNPRYLSVVINQRFGKNYSSLINEFRVRESSFMLRDRRYAKHTMEDISKTVGFANRQSFYAAFYKIFKCTPKEYRNQEINK
ncbi:MAG: AraC family transcriptional regulator [Bacteroidales bacterium]|nr:AraC family transcriptional regulator [Candidatus Physcousia equi]